MSAGLAFKLKKDGKQVMKADGSFDCQAAKKQTAGNDRIKPKTGGH
ncbi:hypothetical protein [Ruegeria atlantica]|nr:hypothetical protein [Ruegeria atlantica]